MTTTETPTSTDRIEKRFTFRAPRSRVWRALTTAEEFGAWFGVQLEGPFAEGAAVRGKLTIKRYEDVMLELFIERIQPEHHFAYRWHPYAVDPEVDYSAEPTTLVEFRLDEVDGGTQLTIIEPGFDRLPASRRVEAFRMNDGGWTGQAKNLERYVTAG